ncbi:MAG: histidine phosphatase family protein [bacterium]
MNIYFVRHGETESKANGQYQNDKAPLSDKGIAQAKLLANRFRNIEITKIISSSHIRALDTAKEISLITKLPFEESEIFIERKRPGDVYSMDRKGEDAKNIEKMILNNYSDINWHYSDEENFSDLKKRAIKAIEFLRELKSDTVIVSHSTFLKMVVLIIIFKDNITPQMFLDFDKHVWYANTGITQFDYSEGKWHMVTWSDQAHLGELLII